MPEPSLVIWILVAPLVLAVVDLVRTFSAIKAGGSSPGQAGAWSRALHVNGH